jgi:cation transport regulator
MPYGDNSQLPLSVSGRLPIHAQDIYREAFNHAWVEYGQDEVVAARVAWAAVKRRYEKRRGRWVPLADADGSLGERRF